MRYTKFITLFVPVLLISSVELKAAEAGSTILTTNVRNTKTLSLSKGGSIVSWGIIAFDSRELDSNDFVAIAAGSQHALALKSDGSIVGWGWNPCGQTTPPKGNDFIAIAAGYLQSLAIRKEPCPDQPAGD